MAFSAPSSASGPFQIPSGSHKPLGFLAIAKKRKHSFIQFAAMTEILLLSCRSLSQKYRIYNLTEDAAALREDQEGLSSRMDHIKRSLLAEAALEHAGNFVARLQILFGDESN